VLENDHCKAHHHCSQKLTHMEGKGMMMLALPAVDARSGAMLVDPAMPLIVDEEALPAVPALDLFSFALSHFFHGSFLV